MFGGGFRAFSRFSRQTILRGSPVFCAALLVTIPPRRRKERFQEGVTSFIGLGSFFLPKVPIPDLSILKRPLFRSSDDDDRDDSKGPFVNGNPQADIIVGVDIGPVSTQAVVVYFPKDANFPAELPDPHVSGLNEYFPNSRMDLVMWPRLRMDQGGEVFMAQAVETGIVLFPNEAEGGGNAFIMKIGAPTISPQTSDDPWRRFIPGFHFLTTLFIAEDIQETYGYNCEDILSEFLRGVRVHIEEFIEQEIAPKALVSGEKVKIKWLISNLDAYDKAIDKTGEEYEPKKTFWECLRKAGYPVGDGSNDAGMWDPYMLDGMRQKGDPFHIQVDSDRAASMVEMVGRGLLASYFSIATCAPEERLPEGSLMLVVDDTMMGCMSRLVRIDNNERFGLVEYREVALSESLTNSELRTACLAAVENVLERHPESSQIPDNFEHDILWDALEDRIITYAHDWALGRELEGLSQGFMDANDESKKFMIDFTKDDMEFIIGFGLVIPFLVHLDHMISVADNSSVIELQDVVVVNDLTNNGDILGVIFTRIIEMLKTCEPQDRAPDFPLTSPTIDILPSSSSSSQQDTETSSSSSQTQTTDTPSPSSSSQEQTGDAKSTSSSDDTENPSTSTSPEDTANKYGFSAEMSIGSSPGNEETYLVERLTTPIRDFPWLISQMPNLRERSFEGFTLHRTDKSMVLVGMTAACSDELNRMYLKAMGWSAGTRAYLTLNQADEEGDD